MAGTWQNFTAPSGVSADTMLLLTDGTVLVHNADGSSGAGTGGNDWYRLTPDDTGSYRNGTWSGALRMATERQFFATGVMQDGRVFAVGGEYATGFAQDGCALGEIFDPRTNTWSAMNKPSPTYDFIAGDCAAVVLADGRVLFAGNPTGSRTAIYDPRTDTWVEAGLGFNPGGAQTKTGVRFAHWCSIISEASPASSSRRHRAAVRGCTARSPASSNLRGRHATTARRSSCRPEASNGAVSSPWSSA